MDSRKHVTMNLISCRHLYILENKLTYFYLYQNVFTLILSNLIKIYVYLTYIYSSL